MKKIYTLIAVLLTSTTTFAQVPQKMSYQAVIRDASNVLITNTNVGMRISILQTTATGTAVYVETQIQSTNINGLVSLQIGSGTIISGTFAAINWANGPYFIKIETDPTGGTTYSITGTSEFLSVPYSLYSLNGGATNFWGLSGNAGTVNNTNFIGTTDNVPLNFKVNNQKAGRIDPTFNNVFFGNVIGNVTNFGEFNTSIGSNSLSFNNFGNRNTATGSSSLYTNTSGSNNTANGYRSLYSNTTGNFNMANGSDALYFNTQGSSNVAMGNSALYSNTTGNSNSANGFSALYYNTTGNSNTANGNFSLYRNTTWNSNLANGSYALFENTTGQKNVANGSDALFANSIGNYNTATGSSALRSNTIGDSNTANGFNALQANTSGYGNTASGGSSLFLNTTGIYNTGIGSISLESNTTGNYNTALGFNTGTFNTIGSSNTFIGNGANTTINNLTNTTAIGANAVVSQSNSLILGNNANVGIGTATPFTKLDVQGNVQIGVNGTTINNIIKATINADIASIAANTSANVTFAVPNAALTSTVYLSPASAIDGLIIGSVRVSAAGIITARFYNITATAINPAAMDFYISIIE